MEFNFGWNLYFISSFLWPVPNMLWRNPGTKSHWAAREVYHRPLRENYSTCKNNTESQVDSFMLKVKHPNTVFSFLRRQMFWAAACQQDSSWVVSEGEWSQRWSTPQRYRFQRVRARRTASLCVLFLRALYRNLRPALIATSAGQFFFRKYENAGRGQVGLGKEITRRD